jgi:hypothetical protein
MAARGRLTRRIPRPGAGPRRHIGGVGHGHARKLGDLTLLLYQAMGSGDIPSASDWLAAEGPARHRHDPASGGSSARSGRKRGVGGCFPVTPGDRQPIARGRRLGGRPALRLPGLPAIRSALHPGWPCRARPDAGRAPTQRWFAADVARKRAIVDAGSQTRAYPCGRCRRSTPHPGARGALTTRRAGDHERNDYICTSRTGASATGPIGRDLRVGVGKSRQATVRCYSSRRPHGPALGIPHARLTAACRA